MDQLVTLALGCNGVFGSRMTGGGFGGCTVTLVAKEAVSKCVSAMKKGYDDEDSKRKATFFVCSPAQGATIVQL